jgi:hypothetical protein
MAKQGAVNTLESSGRAFRSRIPGITNAVVDFDRDRNEQRDAATKIANEACKK